MASMERVHIVSRSTITDHRLIERETTWTPLEPSSVRARISSIALTSNNYTYASKGSILGLWNIFPIPQTSSAPSEGHDWGIVPAWGYVEVLESNIESIPEKSSLFGVWPMSSHTITLKLQPGDAQYHWFESSPYRAKFWDTTNWYISHKITPEIDPSIICKPLLEPALLLSTYVFPTNLKNLSHPLPRNGAIWTASDADLSAAVVVILSASSKSGRALAWQLQRNRDSRNGGPLALLQATSNPDAVLDYRQPSLPTLTTRYEDLGDPSTLSWIEACSPQRVVVFDFGAPVSRLATLVSALESHALRSTVIGVGGEARPPPSTGGPAIKKIPFNTSDVREHAKATCGAQAHFDSVDEAYERFVLDGGVDGITINWRTGDQGIFDAWLELSGGTVSSTSFTVVKI